MKRGIKRWAIPFVLLGVIATVVVFFVSRATQDSDTVTPAPTLPTLPVPDATQTPTPTPTPTADCEGPDTVFNVDGDSGDSLLPDCGQTPVTVEEQQERGLSLGCGGKYPTILFKSNTGDTRISVCGKDASGVDFRIVVKERGQDVQDMAGDYIWQRDAFVGKKAGVRYEIRGYDGSVHITRHGATTVQETDDWISLGTEFDDG